jgi:sugar-specific transcriptional regulator TrmB
VTDRIEFKRISTLLNYLGCSDSEAMVYVKCLEIGHSSVNDIAKQLGKNRVTIHGHVELLLKKGLLYETRKGKRRLIGAEKPEILNFLVEKKENELQSAKSNLDYVTTLLATTTNTGQNVPTVKFYEDTEGLKKMLRETLSAKGDVLVFSHVELLAELLGVDYLEGYFRKRASKNIHTRLIFPPCTFADRVSKKSKQYKIEVRTLDPNYSWSSGIFSWDNNIALLSYTNNKITTTIIQNSDISDFFRSVMFDMIWNQAKEV